LIIDSRDRAIAWEKTRMESVRSVEVIGEAFAKFEGRTDYEWLSLLQRSVSEELIEGVRFPRFPADSLQAQFVGSANDGALQEACQFYIELKRWAAAANVPVCAQSRVLDFGCGWGRYLRFFWKDVSAANIFGVDVDPSILEVCKETGVPGNLTHISPTGKLPFADGFFSHVMAYSVFTHLPKDIHLHWMTEIARVMQSGATFSLTLEPRRFLDFVEQQRDNASSSPWHEAMARFSSSVPTFKQAFDAGQIAYLPTGGGDYRHADVYGDAAVPLAFIEQHWSEYFDILTYIDDPVKFWQAVLVVRRR
jgi:ubiquinone/menaquinone biosynthesis C-methylase UbiE